MQCRGPGTVRRISQQLPFLYDKDDIVTKYNETVAEWKIHDRVICVIVGLDVALEEASKKLFPSMFVTHCLKETLNNILMHIKSFKKDSQLFKKIQDIYNYFADADKTQRNPATEACKQTKDTLKWFLTNVSDINNILWQNQSITAPRICTAEEVEAPRMISTSKATLEVDWSS
ncbi:Hypothetical predicted protein [Cloeon dipterum]|uniref:Uncharacterized protein n=1 Tax=Cloeon dipterum TaxID=197152 RepID=A0A8S1DZ40_9INSE|nr:Hypothetical predicted protein [Cloeon dipterum]